MNNLINVTKCDNELIIIAYQWTQSFEVAKIKSGNWNAVDANIQIAQGTYNGPVELNGVDKAITSEVHTLNLPAGDYQLVAVGIDWGGPAEFKFTFNGAEESIPLQQEGDGIVFQSEAIEFKVQ